MSECSCLGEYDEDGGILLAEEIRTARKTHVCDSCKTAIMPGDKYHRHVWKDGGIFYTTKTHVQCLDLLAAAGRYFGTGWFYGCDFTDCVEGWSQDVSDPVMVEKIDAVFEIMNRAAADEEERISW